MPRSYDINPVAITHHPTQRIDTGIGKLPPFDLQQIVDGFLTALKDLTGIDLTGIRDFLENLFGSIDWSHLPTPADVWAFVVAAGSLPGQIVTFINNTAGINLASWDDFVASLADGKGIDLPWLKTGLDTLSAIFGGLDLTDPPTPEEVWSTVVTNFINPLINVVEAVAEALLTAPLNAANLFGRIALGQFGSGVPIMALTTAVPNELEPFTAASVPTSDGWSFNASEDAAQVVCDGSPKTLYLKSGVIKVEAGQPINTTVPVAITHHPTQRIDTGIGKLPPFDLQQIVDGFLTALKDLTGIDLTGIRDFLENLFGSIDWSHLPTPADVWAFVVAAGSLPGQIVTFINNTAGINLASWDDFVASLADGKGIDLPC
ncbi:hypothetical protein BN970_07134 [Mycolicibacterium conceptionense]|uniref:Minor tail protein n=1 Tax=Mycolicibacterium conceptionense TaxID=451644 RepID=A0A0U1DZ55_9MYCO|nr:hypothetical protein BN970_07134 [Mycolicibacterium conceptionense]